MAKVAEPEKPTTQFDQTYHFRLRRHKGGNFHGLWELTLLNKMGHPLKVVDDANALNFVMDNLQGEIEADGF